MQEQLEKPILFKCCESDLMGIFHPAARPHVRGILVVTGGPQYRVGSHRQFVYLARELASKGFPVMRFDYRGMGDSDGPSISYYDAIPDLQAAIDAFFQMEPALREVVIWGLCDAASLALLYGRKDKRVSGLVLLNPWVRTESTLAKTYFRHYYVEKLFSSSFWKKIFIGQFNAKQSILSLLKNIKGIAHNPDLNVIKTSANGRNIDPYDENNIPDAMKMSMEHFLGRILLILSGDDLTAAEFKDLVENNKSWKRLLCQQRVKRIDIKDANHTFSSARWRGEVVEHTYSWLVSW